MQLTFRWFYKSYRIHNTKTLHFDCPPQFVQWKFILELNFTDGLNIFKSWHASFASLSLRVVTFCFFTPTDYVGFIKKVMKLLQTSPRYRQIKKVDVDLVQLEESEAVPPSPGKLLVPFVLRRFIVFKVMVHTHLQGRCVSYDYTCGKIGYSSFAPCAQS